MIPAAELRKDVREARRKGPISDLVIGGKPLDWDDLSGVQPQPFTAYIKVEGGGRVKTGREARDALADHLIREGDPPEYAHRVATTAAIDTDRGRAPVQPMRRKG